MKRFPKRNSEKFNPIHHLIYIHESITRSDTITTTTCLTIEIKTFLLEDYTWKKVIFFCK